MKAREYFNPVPTGQPGSILHGGRSYVLNPDTAGNLITLLNRDDEAKIAELEKKASDQQKEIGRLELEVSDLNSERDALEAENEKLEQRINKVREVIAGED